MSEEERPPAGADAAPDPTEVAGETVAADMVSGPADTRPVGAGTLADVEGEGAPEGRAPRAAGGDGARQNNN